MTLREILAEAQQDPIDRHLQKIDDAFGAFLTMLDTRIEEYLAAVSQGGTPDNPRCAVPTPKTPHPDYKDLTKALERIRELPSYKKLLDYCAAPERDACCDLMIRYLSGSQTGGDSRTDVSFEIRPAQAFAESTISTMWEHKLEYREEFAKSETKPAPKAAPLPQAMKRSWGRLSL